MSWIEERMRVTEMTVGTVDDDYVFERITVGIKFAGMQHHMYFKYSKGEFTFMHLKQPVPKQYIDAIYEFMKQRNIDLNL